MPIEPVRAASPLPHLLEVYEVAYYLKSSHEFVRREIRTGRLAAIPFGKRGWRVHPADLHAYIERQRGQIAREEAALDRRFRALSTAKDAR